MFYVSISTPVTYKDTSGHQGYGIIRLNTYKLMLSHFCDILVLSKERFHDIHLLSIAVSVGIGGLRPGHPREWYKLYISLSQLSLYFPIRTPASGGFIVSELWLKG